MTLSISGNQFLDHSSVLFGQYFNIKLKVKNVHAL